MVTDSLVNRWVVRRKLALWDTVTPVEITYAIGLT
jgi:hypothetical protein